jgi:ElaB/YqjD/DUF883 family membrane-anchored ribosome-binding protein
MNWKMPKRPKEPPKPLMRIARPGMEEMISRIQDLAPNDAKRELLERAEAWPRYVAGLPKDQIKQVRQQAGEMLEEFNQRFSHEDGKGPIRTM